jgi:hypothetical protein
MSKLAAVASSAMIRQKHYSRVFNNKTRMIRTMYNFMALTLLLVSLFVSAGTRTDCVTAFQQQQHRPSLPPSSSETISTALFMGKLRNRQAELQKKMAIAKQQNKNKGDDGSSSSSSLLSAQEIKEQNDRKRFDELLKGSVALQFADDDVNDVDLYLNQQQEEEEIDAYSKLM